MGYEPMIGDMVYVPYGNQKVEGLVTGLTNKGRCVTIDPENSGSPLVFITKEKLELIKQAIYNKVMY